MTSLEATGHPSELDTDGTKELLNVLTNNIFSKQATHCREPP